jgi:hypothetical protein
LTTAGTAFDLLPLLLLLSRTPLLLLLLLLLQVARWLGERLADTYRFKYMATDNDMPLMKELQPANLDDRWGLGNKNVCVECVLAYLFP